MLRRLSSAVVLTVAALAAPAVSQWVSTGPDHRLHYRADAHGNRIMDFSYAGYRAGGVRLPDLPAVATLGPKEGDNTPQIQAAIDAVSRRAPDAKGFRGAALLRPGIYDVAGTLTISSSGVVLRGSGSGDSGTTIRLIGAPHRFLEIHGAGALHAAGESARITDAYVPSGARTFHADKAALFHAGDTVVVNHPVTTEWIHFMGMDTLVRDGKPQTWLKAGSSIRTDRVVEAVSGSEITL